MNYTGPVVSNAGPLMVLAKLNVLHLLEVLYGRVQFATSVYEEVVTAGMLQGHDDARTLSLFLNQVKWSPRSVDTDEIPADIRTLRLDRGERDTLALAHILRSRLVLIDDSIARQVARDQGLAVRGSLGVLVEAYRKGLLTISQLRLNLIEIAHRQDIWIAPALVERLLHEFEDELHLFDNQTDEKANR